MHDRLFFVLVSSYDANQHQYNFTHLSHIINLDYFLTFSVPLTFACSCVLCAFFHYICETISHKQIIELKKCGSHIGLISQFADKTTFSKEDLNWCVPQKQISLHRMYIFPFPSLFPPLCFVIVCMAAMERQIIAVSQYSLGNHLLREQRGTCKDRYTAWCCRREGTPSALCTHLNIRS